MISDTAKRDLAKVSAVAAMVFLLFFRARWAFDPGMGSDEGCYLGNLGNWIGVPLEGCAHPLNFYPIGAPIIWLPAALAGLGVASITSDPPATWIIPLAALWSFVLWAITLFFIHATLISFPVVRNSGWSRIKLAVITLLCSPLLYYATHRTLMGHTAEGALAAATVYFAVNRRWAFAVISAGMLTLTRPNDFPGLFIIFGAYLDSLGKSAEELKKQKIAFGLAAVLIFAAIAFATFHGMQNFNLLDLIGLVNFDYFPIFFFGLDFGIVYTAPWLLIAFALGTAKLREISWTGRAAWLWIAAELSLAYAWNGNGSDFGYRYLIGSYAGAVVLWMDLLVLTPKVRTIFRVSGLINALFLTYLLITYKTIPGMGAHAPYAGIFNPDFIWKSITAPVAMPKVFKVAFYQQLPLETLALSFYRADEPLGQAFGIRGPSLLLLLLAVVAVTSTLLLCAVRSWKTRTQVDQDSNFR